MDCRCCHHYRARRAWFQQPAPPHPASLPIFSYLGVTRCQDGDRRLRPLWASKMLFRNLRDVTDTTSMFFLQSMVLTWNDTGYSVHRYKKSTRYEHSITADRKGTFVFTDIWPDNISSDRSSLVLLKLLVTCTISVLGWLTPGAEEKLERASETLLCDVVVKTFCV